MKGILRRHTSPWALERVLLVLGKQIQYKVQLEEFFFTEGSWGEHNSLLGDLKGKISTFLCPGEIPSVLGGPK